jgi:secreted Zn-dependent insulinase-like peptidase
VINALTPADVTDHIPRLLSSLDIEMFAHGNISADEALNVAALLQKTLACRPLFPSQIPEQRIVRLPENTRYFVQIPDYNPVWRPTPHHTAPVRCTPF